MKTYRLLRRLLLICLISCPFLTNAQQKTYPTTTCQVYFSPRGGATSAVLQALDNAKSSVLVQAYSFTSEPIAEALVRARARGVNVQVLLDRSQRTQRYTTADVLFQAGISVLVDASHAIAHNKVIIIDNEVVVTGSFNFTKAAEERNAENLLIISSKEVAARYVDNWWAHLRHSVSFGRKVDLK